MWYICIMKYIGLEQYKLSGSRNNSLVLVDIDLLISKLKVDTPEYFVGENTNNPYSICRITNAMNYVKKNLGTSGCLEASLISAEDGRLGVIDGRHRIIAAKKIGYTHIYVDIPNKYKKVLYGIT